MKIQLWKRIATLPPAMVRLLAREKRGGRVVPLTDEVIAQRAGMSTYEVMILSQALDWRGVDVDVLRRFTQACNCDFTDHDAQRYIQNLLRPRRDKFGRVKIPTFVWLRKSPAWTTQYEPLLKRAAAARLFEPFLRSVPRAADLCRTAA